MLLFARRKGDVHILKISELGMNLKFGVRVIRSMYDLINYCGQWGYGSQDDYHSSMRWWGILHGEFINESIVELSSY